MKVVTVKKVSGGYFTFNPQFYISHNEGEFQGVKCVWVRTVGAPVQACDIDQFALCNLLQQPEYICEAIPIPIPPAPKPRGGRSDDDDIPF